MFTYWLSFYLSHPNPPFYTLQHDAGSRILKTTFLLCQGACNARGGGRDLHIPVLPECSLFLWASHHTSITFFLIPTASVPSYSSSSIQFWVVPNIAEPNSSCLLRDTCVSWLRSSFPRSASSSELLSFNNSNSLSSFPSSRAGKCLSQLLPLWHLILPVSLLSLDNNYIASVLVTGMVSVYWLYLEWYRCIWAALFLLFLLLKLARRYLLISQNLYIWFAKKPKPRWVHIK